MRPDIYNYEPVFDPDPLSGGPADIVALIVVVLLLGALLYGRNMP
jgi:hypothetical protein